MKIPVIDLFAGPGGLGEGFMSLKDEQGKSVFDIKLSIEKDEAAHRTLTWRSFYRQFVKNNRTVPKEYYDAYQSGLLKDREEIIEKALRKYPEGTEAMEEAKLIELGGKDWPASTVDKLIGNRLKGEKDWVLIGGPPCQAYSLVGRSRRQWKENLDNKDPRVHLYKEYLRIIAKHSPAVFVMENVKGLLSSKVDGTHIFDLIRRDLRDPSIVFPFAKFKYKVYSLSEPPIDFLNGQPIYNDNRDYIIKSEKYGVPQNRHRVILLGVREDISTQPSILSESSQKVTLSDVISDLPKLRSGLGRSILKTEIIDGKRKRTYKPEEDNDINWAGFLNRFNQEIRSWDGLSDGNHKAQVKPPKNGIGGEFVAEREGSYHGTPLSSWFKDDKLRGIANHESRKHLTEDLRRYLFASVFTQRKNRFPKLDEWDVYSPDLLPDHLNASTGKFSDRFRVQLPDRPATTVTSHISKDGHYFIHYDPEQCRSLTVREAARIQTFPDNYLFRGSRTQQFHQVGNAVPPYLAYQLSQIAYNILK